MPSRRGQAWRISILEWLQTAVRHLGYPGQSRAIPVSATSELAAFQWPVMRSRQAVPPDPSIVGSLAGDVFINTRKHFTFDKLYRVALHEIGHALGLAPSTDPASIMFNTMNTNSHLSASDVAAIQALYGTRAPMRMRARTATTRLTAQRA